jgi:amino acid adenylation domain-containing protein
LPEREEIMIPERHNDPTLSGDTQKALLFALLQKKAAESGTLHPLSRGQQALWLAHQMAPADAAYNEAYAWRVGGQLEAPVLRRAFQGLLDRHAALRTTYVAQSGTPMQQINRRMPVPFSVIDAGSWTLAERERWLVQESRRPFDLERDAMMRVSLLTCSPAEHVLLVVFHHIAMDLWSLGVLLNDLEALYLAEKTAAPVRLPFPDSRYTDYARWQAGMLAGPKGDALSAYWARQLAGPRTDLNLPTDRPRPPVQTYHGDSYSFPVSAGLAKGLRDLAKQENASLYMVMLAAFQVLLHRYSGQDDILVGSPTSGRLQPAWRRMVGYFVNPVVLRGDLSGNPTWKDFLAQVKRTVLGALEHQEFPFQLVVERLQPLRDPSRSPLFQAHFAWEKPTGKIKAGEDGAAPRTYCELGDLVLEMMPLRQQASKFDLTLMVLESGRSLAATFHYNTDLWDAGTVARMAGHYLTLLEGIVANSDERVGTLPLLTGTEKRQILEDWNDTACDCPLACLHHLIEAQATKTPEARALLQGEESLSYRELDARANQLGRYLRRLGVGPEVKVGLCIDRSLDTIVAILGVLKAGGAYVPLDMAYPKERLAFMLADAQVPVILTQARHAFDLPEHQARVVCLDADQDAFAKESTASPAVEVTPDHLAYVIYTSGSTGRPKGVLVTHRGLSNLAQSHIEAFGVRPDSRVLQFASLSFDASVSDIAMALCAGATLVLGTPETLVPGPALVRLLREQAITTVTLPPAVLANLPADVFPHLATVAAAGEACSAEIVARWAPGRTFLNAYGPTESTVCVTMAACRPDGARPVIGRPLSNMQVHILDGRGQLVPVGVPGELHIAGIGLARGYLNRPELTAERFVANPFRPGTRLYRTGDLARWLPDGTVDFLGRLDHQVKIRGFRIELGEIEAALARHPQVRETVVLAREDEPGEKRLVAYFVAEPTSAPTVNELRRFLKETLPEFMVPAAFVRLDAFPLTPNAKVDRRALPAPDASRPELEQAFVAPATPMQTLLAGIWSQVLGVERIGVFDNFFELGGASIQTLQVAARANALGLALTPEMLFQFQTVAELEAVLVDVSLPSATGAA